MSEAVPHTSEQYIRYGKTNEMIIYFVQIYSKQYRTTSLLDATYSTGKEHVSSEILDVMIRRDDLRKRDPTSPELSRLNKCIQKRIYVHKRPKWRDCVETMDQKTYLTKLWRTIKGIDGRTKHTAEKEEIAFNGISFSSSKQLAAKFNQHFKAGHTLLPANLD